MAFLDYFDNRYKFQMHVIQVVLVIIAIVLTLARFGVPNTITTRAHIMAMTMVGSSSSIRLKKGRRNV